jgi:four helix bundle protein
MMDRDSRSVCSGMQDHKRLRVWHLAQELSLDVIEALSGPEVRRVPGLRNQAVRTANSVSANLAEGCTRPSRVEFLRYVEIAIGSANELESHLGLASRTRILSAEKHANLKERLYMARRMLISLMRALELQIAADENQSRRNTDRASGTDS